MSNERATHDDLVASAKNGDEDAFTAIVRTYTAPVYAHALRVMRDPNAAEDAVQEVFVKVLRSIGSYDGDAAFGTWLYRVTRNTCLDMLRAAKRRPAPVDPLEALSDVTPDFSDQVATSAALETAIAALPPEDRDALNAVTLFGLSYADAGAALGVPAGTVKSRVFRARRTIAAALDRATPRHGGT